MDEQEFDALMKSRPFETKDVAQWEGQLRSNLGLATTLGTALWGKTSEDLQRRLLASHPEIPPSFDLADLRKLLQWTAQMSSAVVAAQRHGFSPSMLSLRPLSLGQGASLCGRLGAK